MSTPKTAIKTINTNNNNTNTVVPATTTPTTQAPQVAPSGGKAPQITLEQFRELAKFLGVSLDGISVGFAEPKEFSTGSLGWYASAKVPVKVGDKLVQCQLGLNLTIIGSKDAK